MGDSIAWLSTGSVQTAVIHTPCLAETFTAIKRNGALCNGKMIGIRKVIDLKDALVVTGLPFKRDSVEQIGARSKKALRKCRDIRRIGAASIDLCWIACGDRMHTTRPSFPGTSPQVFQSQRKLEPARNSSPHVSQGFPPISMELSELSQLPESSTNCAIY